MTEREDLTAKDSALSLSLSLFLFLSLSLSIGFRVSRKIFGSFRLLDRDTATTIRSLSLHSVFLSLPTELLELRDLFGPANVGYSSSSLLSFEPSNGNQGQPPTANWIHLSLSLSLSLSLPPPFLPRNCSLHSSNT